MKLVVLLLGLFLLASSVYGKDGKKDGKKLYSIVDYGAKGDGSTDDRESLEKAWEAACKKKDVVVSIPSGQTFMISQITLKGPCQQNLKLKISGNVCAPPASNFSDSSSSPWIRIRDLNGLTVEATGTVDGNGKTWWERNCSSCRKAPNSVEFDNVKNLVVRGLYVKNSPRMHVNINTCQQVTLDSVRVNSPGSSPNTDGIHVTNSQNVMINNAMVAAGDDCVSIVAGSSNVNIDTITCGPGHGISIGSLGGTKSNTDEENVSGVTVSNAKLTGTTNGLRIKTYNTGQGSVSDITYKDIEMDDVQNPIIINQDYCDSHNYDCKEVKALEEDAKSVVRISNVVYKNITGTSKSKAAITLKCSKLSACTGIQLSNVQLSAADGSDSDSMCRNAFGLADGQVSPVSCLVDNSLGSRSRKLKVFLKPFL